MVNRKLRKDLLGRLRSSKQALSQRARRLKEAYGPMTTDEAVYLIAHMQGLDLSRYLPLASLDRIRSLVPHSAPGPLFSKPPPKRKPKSKKALAPPYPLLSPALSRQGTTLGADVFPLLFQLENSIRQLIEKVLSKTGRDWWVNRVPLDVQNNVQRTMDKEKRYAYRSPRASHPLYYANFDDLKKIVLHQPNQPNFQPIIGDLDWFRAKMNEVYMARNNLAHCVPLPPLDIYRILVFHRDWAQLLGTKGIP